MEMISITFPPPCCKYKLFCQFCILLYLPIFISTLCSPIVYLVNVCTCTLTQMHNNPYNKYNILHAWFVHQYYEFMQYHCSVCITIITIISFCPQMLEKKGNQNKFSEEVCNQLTCTSNTRTFLVVTELCSVLTISAAVATWNLQFLSLLVSNYNNFFPGCTNLWLKLRFNIGIANRNWHFPHPKVILPLINTILCITL